MDTSTHSISDTRRLRVAVAAIAAAITAGCGARGGPAANPTAATASADCGHPEARSFDFMVGEWRSSKGSTHRVEPLLGGCAQQGYRSFDGGDREVRAVQTRVFDLRSKRWMMSYVDDGLTFQQWEGRRDGDAWWFYRAWVHPDGTDMVSRVAWTPDGEGFALRIEQSRDDGATWKLHWVEEYRRVAR